MAEQVRTNDYKLSREGDIVTYSVKEKEGEGSAFIRFSLAEVFGVDSDGIAAEALCSAIRAAARYAVAAKDASDWQVALDELLDQWKEGDWSVSGEGSVPFGVGAPVTKAILSVYGEKFGGSAMAAAKAANDKLLQGLGAQEPPISWDDATDPEKNKYRRAFEKQWCEADPAIALFLAELYAKQAAERATKKLAEQRAKLEAGGGKALF
jgi:hypothetical protein